MIIDTSALMAILLYEPEAARIADSISFDDTRLISNPTLVEAHMVALSRTKEQGVARLEKMLAELKIEPQPFTDAQRILAQRAFYEYGKGRHAAGLNYGDCFSYALAIDTGEPLLFKGTDFNLTDVKVAEW